MLCRLFFDHGQWYRNDLVPPEWRGTDAPPPGALAHVRRLGRKVGGRLSLECAATAPAANALPPVALMAARNDLRGWPGRIAKADLRVRFRSGDVLFSPGFWHDLPLAALLGPKARGVQLALLVHDLLPLTHPQNL